MKHAESTGRQSGAGARWRRRAAAASVACIVLFAVVLHWPMFLQGKTVSAFDLAYFSMGLYRGAAPPGLERPSNALLTDPVVMYQVWDVVRIRGDVSFPWLWNPHSGSGSPLLANGESTPFFPLKALAYALAGPLNGFGLLCFAKVLVAGLLMFAFLRRVRLSAAPALLGALAFAGSGFMIAWLQWAHTNVAMCVPMVFIGCEDLLEGRRRRGFLLVAVANALGLLGGHPETSLHVSLAGGVYLVARLLLGAQEAGGLRARAWWHRLSAVGLLCGGLMAGGLVAAVQVVPMVEYIGQSARLAARAREAEARVHPSPLSRPDLRRIRAELIGLLLPNTYGNPALHSHWWREGTNYNESAGYIGVGGFLLSVLAWRYARRDRRIVCLGIVQLLSLGFIVQLPLVVATLGRLPLLNIAANRRFLLIWCFAAAALAAFSFEHVRRSRRIARTDLVWIAAVALVMVMLVGYDFFRRFAHNPYDWIRTYGRWQVLHFGCFFVPWLVLLVLPTRLVRVRDWLGASLAVALGVDVLLIHVGYNPFIAAKDIYPRVAAIEFLQGCERPTRVLPIDTHVGPNILGVYGLDDVRLYDAQVYEPYDELLGRLGSFGAWRIVRDPDMRLCSIAGVQYLLAAPDWAPASEGLPVVYGDETSIVLQNTEALPLSYVCRAWRPVASPQEAYKLLTTPDFPWRACVVVEQRPDAQIRPAPAEDARALTAATLVEHGPRRVLIELPEGEEGILVLNDCYSPGWRATVDGERRPIFRVNGTFRGVFVEAGDKQVAFAYGPLSFRYGAAISALGVAILVAIALGLPSAFGRRVGSRLR